MANVVYLALVYFLLSLPSLLINYHSQDEVKDAVLSNAKVSYIQNSTETFDFIVIGGGSAGAVIANRLSKYQSASVLLLERGSTPTPLSSIPYLWLYLLGVDSGSLTRYPTVPMVNFSKNTNGIINFLSGRVLGGTSTLNQMVYTRGNRRGYDEWATLTGDNSWTYDNLLPFFKKFEDYHGVYENPFNSAVHSTGGEIYVEGPNLVEPSASTFLSAITEKGLPIKDLNEDQTEGFTPIDFNSKNGRRHGTYEAFLADILGRSNLQVYTYATATKIHLDSSKKAYGVTYTRHGQTRYVQARKEIIISSGIFESPKLLMLSGIGPANDLSSIGITPVVDLPVGKKLIDHLALTVQVNLNKAITFVPERDLTVNHEIQYLTNGTGPIRNMFSVLGYLSTSQNANPSWPNLQFFVSHQTNPGTDPVAAASTIRPDSNLISIYLVKPQSTPGTVKLSSNDPTAPLVIDAAFATNPSDIQSLVEGMKFVVNVYENSTTYSSIGAQLVDAAFPAACKALEYRSDAYYECVARAAGTGGYHFVGTCSMGKSSGDPSAVVDSQLRVLGTTNLRVADASVMPQVPNANTNVPSIMIGERAADLILRRWGYIIDWPWPIGKK